MIKSKAIEIPIYKGYLVVIFTDDTDELVNKFPNLSEFDFEGLYAHFIHDSYNDWQGYYIIFNPKNSVKLTKGTVAHEAFHALSYIFDYIGIDIDTKNPEPTTYFLGWIVDTIHEVANSFKIKI